MTVEAFAREAFAREAFAREAFAREAFAGYLPALFICSASSL
jgi:hypothetical protein